ncbi:MAG TPA: ankyrin repeat domain-containing protein [Gemmatimonadales bacterium]|nr:ankyrin repeat domain-containing protein [Gemmatimonadales bacterium]
MPHRRLPVRPDLAAITGEVDALVHGMLAGDAGALLEWREHHPAPTAPPIPTLEDARLVIARAYQAPDWPRLVHACTLADAIWHDDVAQVQQLIVERPAALHEPTLLRTDSNWGPPMTYAANLGRDRIIELLHAMGARDLATALDRAALQGQVSTARMLHRLLGSPPPPEGALGGPAYTLSVGGTQLLLELGASVRGADGARLAPVDVVLETDSRKPEAKHRILELYVEHGLELPDTPVMALHRGRIDLLEAHLARDPLLLSRRFRHEEIYPPELGCHDEVQATQGTPLAGTTLLHLCADYDELEIAEWLIARGMDVNLTAEVDADGFGGHTALFGTVVSQPAFWMNYGGQAQVAPFTELFLSHGANPNVRASIRKQLHPGYGNHPLREYRDVTALSWGRRFEEKVFVSEPAMRLIEAAGGLS